MDIGLCAAKYCDGNEYRFALVLKQRKDGHYDVIQSRAVNFKDIEKFGYYNKKRTWRNDLGKLVLLEGKTLDDLISGESDVIIRSKDKKQHKFGKFVHLIYYNEAHRISLNNI